MRLIASVSALLLGLLVAGCNGEVVVGGQRTPARLVLVSGDLQSGTVGQELPAPLVVRVLDDKGRPVKGQTVNFRVISGGGSVFAGVATTDKEGEARERWTLGTVAADTQRVEARAVNTQTGAPMVFGVFRAIALPDAPIRVSKAIYDTVDGVPETPVPYVGIKVMDMYGNPISGITVNWNVTSGGGTVAAPSTQTGADGTATADWRLGNVAGVQTLRGQAGSLPPEEFSARLRLPASIAFVAAPAVVPANGSAEFVVVVRDSMAQLLPNTLVQWSLTGAGGTLTPVSARTASDGTARATLAVGTAQTNFTVRASTGGKRAEALAQVSGPILITELSTGGSRGIYPYGGASARITSSAGAITGAQVTIYGRSAPMTFDATDGKWAGRVILSDAPGGPLDASITAQDAAGNTRVLAFTVVNDPNPVITILEPGSDTVSAKGSIRIRATCSSYEGRSPNLCRELYSSVYTDYYARAVPSAQGRTEVDVVVPLPAGPASVPIYIQWTDAHGVYHKVLKIITVNVQP